MPLEESGMAIGGFSSPRICDQGSSSSRCPILFCAEILRLLYRDQTKQRFGLFTYNPLLQLERPSFKEQSDFIGRYIEFF